VILNSLHNAQVKVLEHMNPTPDPLISVDERLPMPGRWVIVITDSYRCLGYVDETGIWKDTTRHQVIEGVKAWSRAGDQDTIMLKREDLAE
jgi:hypothetical protein